MHSKFETRSRRDAFFPDAGDPTADSGGGKTSPQSASKNSEPPPLVCRFVTQISPSDLWRLRLVGGNGHFQALPAFTCHCNNLGSEIDLQFALARPPTTTELECFELSASIVVTTFAIPDNIDCE
jgi:hypothetical protein